MKKEDNVLRQILGIINDAQFDIGSSLPSERKLSTHLNVSRNTVRSALQKLEARGIIDIRSGSGCYLLCKYGYVEDLLKNKNRASSREIQNLIEARYLFEPDAVYLSAERMSKDSLLGLEKCLSRFSQAIIAMKKEDMAKEDIEFRRIIYCSSKNRFLIFTMNQLIINNQYFFQITDQFNEMEKDTVFADYVGILKGLKQRDALLVQNAVKGNILRMCELLVKYTDVQLSDFMQEAVDHFRRVR
jgi:GntR family transcriptional regulator, transcriptional repressor for pyruvate dehydrogenase complex